MASPSLVECSFFLPVRRDAILSDGQIHSVDAWEWLDDELFESFGGRTIAPGLYEGFYPDPDTGEKVNDQSRRYIVAVTSDDLNSVRALLREACKVFQQKCIYLSVSGQVEMVQGIINEPG
jgi:hypothetical protein